MPVPHKLTLKKGCPVMLLRNLDPKLGICNGTRLICRNLLRNCINGSICGNKNSFASYSFKKCRKWKLTSPFELTRKQFPVRFAGALTVNKSQGQTIANVGIFLPDHVFSHGQLYVALSRSETTTKVLVKKGQTDGHTGVFTRHVVYKELSSSSFYITLPLK